MTSSRQAEVERARVHTDAWHANACAVLTLLWFAQVMEPLPDSIVRQ